MVAKHIILGTRGSKLALAQADIAKKRLEHLHPHLSFDIQIVHTTGDIDLKSPLSEIGGKGVFIKELEVALQKNIVDIAVHSLKDITTSIPADLVLKAFFKAEAVADVLILKAGMTHFDQLPLSA